MISIFELQNIMKINGVFLLDVFLYSHMLYIIHYKNEFSWFTCIEHTKFVNCSLEANYVSIDFVYNNQ